MNAEEAVKIVGNIAINHDVRRELIALISQQQVVIDQMKDALNRVKVVARCGCDSCCECAKACGDIAEGAGAVTHSEADACRAATKD